MRNLQSDTFSGALRDYVYYCYEGELYAKEKGLTFLETSAKTAHNVNKLFYETSLKKVEQGSSVAPRDMKG
ncbi:hypothetical protein V6N12_056982 [Hibiscus sabdariffa]|uniref:Uncharacterized protein n=1 Tax=Hibiscus sabdariffa TaxID=183260 RepID=A0ABR2DCN6_9ROSI